jgi:predicted nucleic acid-binding protein
LRGAGNLDIVVDASVILSAYLPDENMPFAQKLLKDYALGRINLYGPRLLLLELLNACLVAEKRGKVNAQLINKLMEEIIGLQINWVEVEAQIKEVFAISKRFNLTAYDACYVVAAQMKGCILVTRDQKLYNAVKNSLSFVIALESIMDPEIRTAKR